jgi:hypothetical protein
VRLAFLGAGVDEVGFVGFGVRIPRVGAGVDPGGGRGDEAEGRIRQCLFNFRVLGVGRVQVLQQVVGILVLTLRPQGERLGERAVDGGHVDRACGFLEIGLGRGEHAEPGERDAERHAGGMCVQDVQRGVVDHRRQQPNDIRPALGAVADRDATHLACSQPGRRSMSSPTSWSASAYAPVSERAAA